METTLATAEEPDLATMKVVTAVVTWDSERAQIERLAVTARTLTVTSIDDKAGMKLARATRLTLKELRCAVENKRRELVMDGKKRLAAIDDDAREIRLLIEPLESRLKDQEEFAEREIARQEAETKAMREEELAPFGVSTQFIDLAKMPPDDYAAFFQTAKSQHEAKIAAEKKEQDDRLAKEEAERIERARVIAENIRLKEENAAKEAAAMSERVKAESERRAAEAKAAEALKAEQAKAKAAADKLKAESDERDRVAAEALKKERAEAAERERVIQARAIEAQRIADENTRAQAAKAEEERKAREAVEKELADRRAAEQAKIDAALAEQERAKKAPDAEKIRAVVAALLALQIPEMATTEGKNAVARIKNRIGGLLQFIEEEAESL